jgi:hypothetical protein
MKVMSFLHIYSYTCTQAFEIRTFDHLNFMPKEEGEREEEEEEEEEKEGGEKNTCS